MYRDITNDLITWKNKNGKKPLLLTGVRQCGKTYIVEEFAKNYFENYVYVNFESSSMVSGIFDYDLDVKRIIKELGQLYRTEIICGKTLLFLMKFRNAQGP